MSGFDLGTQTLRETFRHVLSDKTLSPNDDDEFEIKYMAVNGTTTFSRIIAHIPVLSFETKRSRAEPTNEIFLLSPNYSFKNYYLANFGFDTVDENDVPTCEIYASGYQLRQRFSLYPYLAELHPDEAIGISQCSIKNLYSKDLRAKRLEIEECLPGYQTAIGGYLEEVKEARRDVLPASFLNASADRLRIPAAFITSRGTYMVGVYLRDYEAIVTFEVSNDQTLNVMPDLSAITRKHAYELEFEASEISFVKDGKATRVDHRHVTYGYLFEKAERVLRDKLKMVFGHELNPAKKSKLERAMDDTHKYLEGAGYQFNAAVNPGLPKPGSLEVMGRNITMKHIMSRRQRLFDLTEEMTSANDFVKVQGIKKSVFDIRNAEQAMRLRYAA